MFLYAVCTSKCGGVYGITANSMPQRSGAELIIRCALTRLRPYAKHCVTRSTGPRAKKKKRSWHDVTGTRPGNAAWSCRRYFSAPAAQIDAATGPPRKTLSAASMPACTSPRRRSRARNAPQLVPCTRPVPWPDIPLFSLSSSARPSLRPTWNANSLDRILCLLFCFSRVVVQAANHCFFFHSSLIVLIQVFLHFLNLYRHCLLCFSQVFPPFPCVFYFAHAGIGRFSPSNPFDTYLSAFSPYSSRPLFALGPCQKPAAGWVLRLRCSQAFAAIALVPATACAQKQARRRYSLQTPRSPFQATLLSRSPSKSGDPKRKLSSINLQLFLCPLVAAAPERSDTAFLFCSCFERAGDDTLRFLATSPGSAPLRPTFLALDAADRPLEHHPRSLLTTASQRSQRCDCRGGDAVSSFGLFGVYLCFRYERMLDCDFTCRTDSTA